MNNEQFQMLMDLAEKTSDGAFWLVVAFFSVEVIGWLTAAVVAVVLANCLRRAITENGDHEDWIKGVYMEVMESQVTDGTYTPYDHRYLMRKIRTLKDAKL